MRRFGLIIALGFLAASAFMNFQYGNSLGRTVIEGWIYGLVGVLAVGCNAICPFFLAWHKKRRLLLVGIAILWVLSLTYSLTSAIGFAAENRQTVMGVRDASRANYETTLTSLADLEAKRARLKTSRYDEQIERLRDDVKRQRSAGANREADPQSVVLAIFLFVDPQDVRFGLLVLFGALVELGAALVLFAAVGTATENATPATKAPMWRPKGQR